MALGLLLLTVTIVLLIFVFWLCTPVRISGFASVVLGALFCAALAAPQYFTNWLGGPAGNELALAIFIFFLLYLPGFFFPGKLITPTNYTRIPGFVGAQYLGLILGPGPGWEPWFLGVYTITSIRDKRSGEIGKDDDGNQVVPSYFVFRAVRNLLPDELGEEINAGTAEEVRQSSAPMVISADNVELKIPISGDFTVVHEFKWARAENPERTFQGETLASLRSTAAKFAYEDIIRMKYMVTGLVSGLEAALVLRERHDSGDRAHLSNDKFGNPIFCKLSVPFSRKVGEELAKTNPRHGKYHAAVEELKNELAEKYNRGRPVSEQKSVADFEADGAFDLVYTADKLVSTAYRLGVEINSIQTRNATPTSQDLLDAGAGIESAKLNRVTKKINAKADAEAAKETKKGLDDAVGMEEAARITRVNAGQSEERRDTLRGEGDPLSQLMAALRGRP